MAAKKKIYYGWFVLAGAFIACGMMMYLSINSFSLFVTPVTGKLGITATAFLVCATLRSLGGVISAPFSGKMLDSKGIRSTTVVFALIMAAGFAILIFANSIILFYIGYFIVGIASGSTTAINNAVCSRWFNKYRGLANGIVSAGNGLISFVLSPVLASLIAVNGFNFVYGLIVALLMVCSVLVGLVLLRNDPRDMNLLPDGAQEEAGAPAAPGAKKELPGLTMAEVYKTKSFWFMAFGLGAFTICSLGIVQTWNAAFQSLGMDAVTVAFAVSLYGVACIPAKLIFGAMTDKMSLKSVTIIGFGLFIVAAAMLGLLKTGNVVLLYAFAIMFAIGNSSWQPLFIKYIVHCFGLKSVGSVSGSISMFMNVGGMIGPLVAGAFFDSNGSYSVAYLVFAALTVLCCAAMLLTKKETKD